MNAFTEEQKSFFSLFSVAFGQDVKTTQPPIQRELGGESAKVMRMEWKFNYSPACNAKFERGVVRDANSSNKPGAISKFKASER